MVNSSILNLKLGLLKFFIETHLKGTVCSSWPRIREFTGSTWRKSQIFPPFIHSKKMKIIMGTALTLLDTIMFQLWEAVHVNTSLHLGLFYISQRRMVCKLFPRCQVLSKNKSLTRMCTNYMDIGTSFGDQKL